ncbi:MAG: hypothetical protein ABIQ73_24990 [Acidimicrobiales bacterium]
MGKKRSRSRYALASMIAVGGLTAVSAVPADAAVTDNKTYTVEVTGTNVGTGSTVWAGDTNATITVKVTNTSPSQSLGSVNLTLQAPFALGSAIKVGPNTSADAVPGDNIVQMRNLGLAAGGGSVTVLLTVDVRTCTATTGSFAINAKQSNDYNGTGNDFYPLTTTTSVSVPGQCQLKFVGQPADALRSTTITTVDYSPGPGVDPVSVEVLDAGGTQRIGAFTPVTALKLELATNPGGIAPSPSFLPATYSAGFATFAPQLSVSAFGYSLRPTSTGLDLQPASGLFDVVDQHVTCAGSGGDCPKTDPVSKGGVSVSTDFGTGADPANLTVSVGAGDAPLFNCGAAHPRTPTTVVSQFVFTPTTGGPAPEDFAEDRTGTFTVSFPDASRPLNTYEVCWAAPYQFQTDGGSLTQPSSVLKPGTTNQYLHVGLLPDCKRGVPLPCVASRSFTKATRTESAKITIVVNADGRDPWAY